MFIIGAGVYFTYSKFQSDVSTATASPSPSPSPLEFIMNQTPPPGQNQPNQQAQTQPTQQKPFLTNKSVGKFPGVLKDEVLKDKKAVMVTSKGNIEFEIYTDTPLTSSNFILLAANGFYDGLTFHRVEDWVVQGGDPVGDGSGGPGYTFNDEPVTKAYTRGIVAMANAGPNTNGSQFFILKKDYPLPPNYTIFGNVTAGMDVVDNLQIGDKIQTVAIQKL